MTETISLCGNCQQRPATKIWTGDGGSLAYIHGFYSRWCEQCVLEAQLVYARQQAERIPELERQLALVMAPEPPP